MNIKISYTKPEDIAFIGTHKIWDQSGGPTTNLTEDSLVFFWPNKKVIDAYDEDTIDVLVARILKVEVLTEENKVQWPVNQWFDESDMIADGDDGTRYVLGTCKRYTLSEANTLYPNVASTRGNVSGVYVK
jgi:hypothetical protein